jgi:hypothetical protein
MANEVDGIALGAIALGGVFIWSGIRGKSVLSVIQSTVQGQSPAGLPQTQGVTSPVVADIASGSSSPVVGDIASGGSVQEILHAAASAKGWGTGSQWQSLQSLEIAEAGWNPRVKNPSSGAIGIAQALGHGKGSATAGTLGNEYGGFGLTDAEAKAANSGSAPEQAKWMVNYIASRWGDPNTAWGGYRARGNWY